MHLQLTDSVYGGAELLDSTNDLHEGCELLSLGQLVCVPKLIYDGRSLLDRPWSPSFCGGAKLRSGCAPFAFRPAWVDCRWYHKGALPTTEVLRNGQAALDAPGGRQLLSEPTSPTGPSHDAATR